MDNQLIAIIKVQAETIKELTEKIHSLENSNKIKSAKQINQKNMYSGEDDTMTFSEYWEKKFYPDKKMILKEGTLAAYTYTYNTKIKEKIGKLKIAEINTLHVQEVINFYSKTNCKKTLIELRTLIVSVLNHAYRNEFLEKPPKILTSYPLNCKQTEKKKNMATPADLEIIKAICLQKILAQDIHQYKYLGILIAIYTGARIGEICFLRFEHIDFENKIISIRGTRLRTANGGGEGSSKVIENAPKSESSIRDIQIADKLLKVLKRYESIDKNFYVATGRNTGTEPREMRSLLTSVLKRNGIEHFSFHKLRHTFITSAIEKTNNVKAVSELAGHSKTSVTLDCYYHPSGDNKKAIVNAIE